MEQILLYLESIGFLSDGLKCYLQKVIGEKKLSKRDVLLRSGHVCREIYFVESGLLRCFYRKRETEISSWFMKEGDVMMSIESFYQQKPSYESIQALEDCSLYYLDYPALQYIYLNFPEFNFIGRVLTEKYYTLWAKQLYGLRMNSAQERFQWLMDDYPELMLRVPSKFLASYLGITEVTLSKIKSK